MAATFHSFHEAIATLFGNDTFLVSQQPVSGGDINRSYRLTLSNGSAVFVKCNSITNLSFFQAEWDGLQALRDTNTIGVPEAYAVGTDESRHSSFLLMEYLDTAARRPDYWETFGRELAALHRSDCVRLRITDTEFPFGFPDDNYIGSSRQVNTPKADWISFFRECRLLPQLQMADRYFDSGLRKQSRQLLDHLDLYLSEPRHPSLIHGDLWSGNSVCGPDGKAWILDPAVYVGHHEADLAMTELFGGYPLSFYKAYHEICPIDAGYRERRDLYNLYHLLNHLNLFGGSYYQAVRDSIHRYAG